MAQYIDKDALIAQIERYIKQYKGVISSTEERPLIQSNFKGRITGYADILSFLDTLEVKEVDLEKEIDVWYQKAPKEFEKVFYEDIEECAKHFFELGLKAQKGEQNMKNITVSMIDIENALNEVAELISVVPQECKGESKESSICRRRWIEISKRINELV